MQSKVTPPVQEQHVVAGESHPERDRGGAVEERQEEERLALDPELEHNKKERMHPPVPVLDPVHGVLQRERKVQQEAVHRLEQPQRNADHCQRHGGVVQQTRGAAKPGADASEIGRDLRKTEVKDRGDKKGHPQPQGSRLQSSFVFRFRLFLVLRRAWG